MVEEEFREQHQNAADAARYRVEMAVFPLICR